MQPIRAESVELLEDDPAAEWYPTNCLALPQCGVPLQGTMPVAASIVTVGR
jgi:hypothetical protein